jgi:Icc-related predicted phosphoesterase
MHGNLHLKVPESDILLIAGDMCPAKRSAALSIKMQHDWLDNDFKLWLREQPVKECVAVAGNHDWIFETNPDMVPKISNNFHYLEDSEVSLFGLRIYGTPVQLPFYNWAFNRDENQIKRYWNNIHDNIDIILLHSPPYGILDKVSHDNSDKNIGSISLNERIDKVRPKLVVFGHNHNEYGIVEKDGIKYVNASLLTEQYKMKKLPIVVEI